MYYSDRPSGSVMGRFTISDEALNRLKATIRAERFFELGDLSPRPMALHRPDFELDVSFEGQRHKVEVYDPEQLGTNDQLRRFLRVWEALYAGLPLKPKW